MAINVELENLYYEDKEERLSIGNNNQSIELLNNRTKVRVAKLKKILPGIDTSEIWNCHYIAYLLQHSETTEDYKQAHKYAKKAVEMGSNVTRWLYAATIDKWLVSQGKAQKYGTQFKKVDGEWQLLPVDGMTSDDERANYYVPPLKEALHHFLGKYNKPLSNNH